MLRARSCTHPHATSTRVIRNTSSSRLRVCHTIIHKRTMRKKLCTRSQPASSTRVLHAWPGGKRKTKKEKATTTRRQRPPPPILPSYLPSSPILPSHGGNIPYPIHSLLIVTPSIRLPSFILAFHVRLSGSRVLHSTLRSYGTVGSPAFHSHVLRYCWQSCIPLSCLTVLLAVLHSTLMSYGAVGSPAFHAQVLLCC
jgi:hypothetical protein